MNHQLVNLFEMSVTDIRANRNRFKSQKDKGLAIFIISALALLILLIPEARDRILHLSRTGDESPMILYVYSIGNICFLAFSVFVFKFSKRYYELLLELDYSRQDVMKLKSQMSAKAFSLVRDYYETHHLLCAGHLLVADNIQETTDESQSNIASN